MQAAEAEVNCIDVRGLLISTHLIHREKTAAAPIRLRETITAVETKRDSIQTEITFKTYEHIQRNQSTN